MSEPVTRRSFVQIGSAAAGALVLGSALDAHADNTSVQPNPSSSSDSGESGMKFLVTLEYPAENAALLSPERGAEILKVQVTPSLEQLAKHDGAVGGVVAGTRTVVFILEAKSVEDVSSFLQGLPFWTLMKQSVSPLESFASRVELNNRLLPRLAAGFREK